MKAEKLVEACGTDQELRAGVEGFAMKMGALKVVKIAHDCALESMSPTQLAGFAWQLREMAEGIEKWNAPAAGTEEQAR